MSMLHDEIAMFHYFISMSCLALKQMLPMLIRF